MKKYLYFVLSVLLFVSCIEDDYYKQSNNCDITSFEIEGQLACNIEDRGGVGYISVQMPVDYDLSNLKVLRAELSPLAGFERDIFSIRDFNRTVTAKVIAEDGKSNKIWYIEVFKAQSNKQLAYSDMKQWTIAREEDGTAISIGGKYAYFPGEQGKYSPWQHAARANKLNGFFSVNPQPSNENSEYARMETKAYPAGNLVNSGIVTGALFTGKFCFDARHLPVVGSDPNPRKLVNLGVRFEYRPTAVRFNIRYFPGAVMKDGKGKVIYENDGEKRPHKDSCDIYFILQNRDEDPNIFYRVATAWLRIGDTLGADGFVSMTIPFIYGEPEASMIAEKPYMRIGGVRGEVSFYRFTYNGTDYDKQLMQDKYAPSTMNPDHIIGLFSASAYGDLFWGAPGSTLDIKDVELLY